MDGVDEVWEDDEEEDNDAGGGEVEEDEEVWSENPAAPHNVARRARR